jgi:hypothetical protein
VLAPVAGSSASTMGRAIREEVSTVGKSGR